MKAAPSDGAIRQAMRKLGLKIAGGCLKNADWVVMISVTFQEAPKRSNGGQFS
jgi:hypothetical protein